MIGTILWILAVCIILFVLILFLIIRLVKFFNYCQRNKNQLQLPEYVKGRYFVARDMYHLESFGQVNQDGKYIVIGVHDLYGSGENFQSLISWQRKNTNSISIISYTQRNIAPNKQHKITNIGILFDDLTDVCVSLKNQYPNQKIILLLEGFNAGFIKLIAKRQLPIEKVIISNLISNFEALKFTSAQSFKKFIGFFRTRETKVTTTVNYDLLIEDNKLYQEKLLAKHIEHYFNQLWQFQRLNNNVIGKVYNSKLKILVIQANNDAFYAPQQFKTLENNKLLQIYYCPFKNHFLFCSQKNSELVWDIIQKFIFQK